MLHRKPVLHKKAYYLCLTQCFSLCATCHRSICPIRKIAIQFGPTYCRCAPSSTFQLLSPPPWITLSFSVMLLFLQANLASRPKSFLPTLYSELQTRPWLQIVFQHAEPSIPLILFFFLLSCFNSYFFCFAFFSSVLTLTPPPSALISFLLFSLPLCPSSSLYLCWLNKRQGHRGVFHFMYLLTQMSVWERSCCHHSL